MLGNHGNDESPKKKKAKLEIVLNNASVVAEDKDMHSRIIVDNDGHSSLDSNLASDHPPSIITMDSDSVSEGTTYGSHNNIEKIKILLKSFVEERDLAFEKDFLQFLHNNDANGEVREVTTAKLNVLTKSPFFELDLHDYVLLSNEEKLHLLEMSDSSYGYPSLSYPWILTMMKYSTLGCDIFGLFVNRYYPRLVTSDKFLDKLLSERSELEMFFIAFFARIPFFGDEEPMKFVSPTFMCPYCSMKGVHFSNECHILPTQQMKDAYLEGYCCLCTDGRSCLGLHDPNLVCRCGEKPDHQKEMCKSDMALGSNECKVVDIRWASLAFRGWNSQKLEKLFLELAGWIVQNTDSPNASWIMAFTKYLEYQSEFSTDLWKINKK